MQLHVKQRARPGLLSTALLLAMLVSFGGCGSWLKTGGPSEAQREAFQEQLVLTTYELNASNLQQAKVHAHKAREHAWGEQQEQKVDSLERLIAGVEALQDGDVELAQSEWSQITDPALKREVAIKASAIGIDVQDTNSDDGKEGR